MIITAYPSRSDQIYSKTRPNQRQGRAHKLINFIVFLHQMEAKLTSGTSLAESCGRASDQKYHFFFGAPKSLNKMIVFAQMFAFHSESHAARSL